MSTKSSTSVTTSLVGSTCPRFLPGEIDEYLLSDSVLPAHGEAVAGEPAAVEIAEVGVAAGAVLFQVLKVEQF